MSLPACALSHNPLQDLVDGVASTTRAAPHSAAASRYSATPLPPTMRSLQIDDTVNLGSRQPSEGESPVKQPLSDAFSAIDQSYVTHKAGALGGAVSAKSAAPQSPAASTRSLQSEALSQLSINAGLSSRPRTPDPDTHVRPNS